MLTELNQSRIDDDDKDGGLNQLHNGTQKGEEGFVLTIPQISFLGLSADERSKEKTLRGSSSSLMKKSHSA